MLCNYSNCEVDLCSFAFENDVTEYFKCHATFFIVNKAFFYTVKCLSKSTVIRGSNAYMSILKVITNSASPQKN